MYRQSEKKLLSSNISSTCPHNMVNFGPLAAEIVSLVWGTPANFNGFGVLAASLHGILVAGGVEQRAPPIFGRATITLGIGPHSSCKLTQVLLRPQNVFRTIQLLLFFAITTVCKTYGMLDTPHIVSTVLSHYLFSWACYYTNLNCTQPAQHSY